MAEGLSPPAGLGNGRTGTARRGTFFFPSETQPDKEKRNRKTYVLLYFY